MLKKNKWTFTGFLLALACTCAVTIQDYRLSRMYIRASGKTRALFGITELVQSYVKVYIGIVLLVSLLLLITGLSQKENKRYLLLAFITVFITAALLLMRMWRWMI